MESYGDLLDVEDDVFGRLISRLNPPRVVIDNESCDHATVIRVNCVKKHGVLLEVIQVLIDLHLIITKAYISSDGSWFMDVFNVTDCYGNKVWDKEILTCIQRTLETDASVLHSVRSSEYTAIELIGLDRPGLLSQVCAVLTDLKCNVVKGKEYYIRHVNGLPISSEDDRKQIIQCLQAAIERRTMDGLELEFRAEERVGLLSDITRIFRENGLCIKRAEISTENGEAIDTFYLSEMSGNNVEAKTIESIKRQISQKNLRVTNPLPPPKSKEETSASLFLLLNFFRDAHSEFSANSDPALELKQVVSLITEK
ncbi:hypothetical protein J5N97_001978 [Dioscorea zingiberensis]|uniref:ACT domain-containing protein ACR n=1 Tax=Dioscorea zingiberensis TaxID=325984 RepID=A0A9D5BT27_9LILI|nr:hypothetical protein J5N97_001978 [Dioscorea zingiberensis]